MSHVQWGLGRKYSLSPERDVYVEIITFLNFPGKEGEQVGRFWIENSYELRERKDIADFGFQRLRQRGSLQFFILE